MEVNGATITVNPAGHIGVASHFLGRYREFDYCLARLLTPQGSSYQYYLGVDVCMNFNQMIRHMMTNANFHWIWILGDDHLFGEDLLLSLLERNVDVVTPLCCRRLNPHTPILHGDMEYKQCASVKDPWEEFSGKSGLLDWPGTSGNAGMLIRRHVLEAMTDPWFENGRTYPGVGAADIYFWHKLHEAGFKTYLDLDNTIGHITHTSVWPDRDEATGKWKAKMISP